MLLQRPGGIGPRGSRSRSAAPAISDRLAADGYEFKTHPIVKLTEDGVDWGVWPEPGDEIGYGMGPYRGDDCFQAAIATATQVPIEQVPDLALDRRFDQGEDRDAISRSSWERIETWARKRGLLLGFSKQVPLPLDRWIGVIRGNRLYDALPRAAFVALRERAAPHLPGRPPHPFQDHCVVMRRDELLFDPSCSVRTPAGAIGLMSYDPEDIDYGIAFVKEE